MSFDDETWDRCQSSGSLIHDIPSKGCQSAITSPYSHCLVTAVSLVSQLEAQRPAAETAARNLVSNAQNTRSHCESPPIICNHPQLPPSHPGRGGLGRFAIGARSRQIDTKYPSCRLEPTTHLFSAHHLRRATLGLAALPRLAGVVREVPKLRSSAHQPHALFDRLQLDYRRRHSCREWCFDANHGPRVGWQLGVSAFQLLPEFARPP